MEVSGIFTVRDAIKAQYPFVECIVSALPLTDEFLIMDGGSNDSTMRYLRRLEKEFEKVDVYQRNESPGHNWDPIDNSLMELKKKANGDWLFEVQADEAFRSEDIVDFRNEIEEADQEGYNGIRQRRVDILRWSRMGDYVYKTVRAVRNRSDLRSKAGGDFFYLEGNSSPREGFQTHNVPPEKDSDINFCHFHECFDGFEKKRAERHHKFLAQSADKRKEHWEEMRDKGPKDSVVENPIEEVPELFKPLSEWRKYRVRDQLFDKEWLSQKTGLEYW